MLDLAKQAAAVLRRREAAVMVTVVNSRRVDDGPNLGAKVLIGADGICYGSLGSAALERAARQQAEAAIEEGEPLLRQYAPDGTVAPRRGRAYVELLFEPLLPPDRLLVIGAGHIAVPLHEIGKILGFEVIVVDDREDFATAGGFPMPMQCTASPLILCPRT